MCDKTQGPYGKLDWGIKGGLPVKPLGAICVAPWPEGRDNGGATYEGVTKGGGQGRRPAPQQPADGVHGRGHR